MDLINWVRLCRFMNGGFGFVKGILERFTFNH